MADTIRARLVETIRAHFEGTLPGQTQFEQVFTEDWDGRRATGANIMYLSEDVETYRETMGAHALDRILPIEARISALVPRASGPSAVYYRVLADVERELMHNTDWGGLAMQTRLLSNLRTGDNTADRRIEISISFEVMYRTSRLDPETH